MTFIEATEKTAKKNFMPMQSAIFKDTASSNSHSINPHYLSVRNPDTNNNKHNPSGFLCRLCLKKLNSCFVTKFIKI
jgi:hypothetical protein